MRRTKFHGDRPHFTRERGQAPSRSLGRRVTAVCDTLQETPSRPSNCPYLLFFVEKIVDSSALRFLTASALEAKRKLEEKENEAKRRREQTAEDEARLELRSLLVLPSARRTAETERRLIRALAPDGASS